MLLIFNWKIDIPCSQKSKLCTNKVRSKDRVASNRLLFIFIFSWLVWLLHNSYVFLLLISLTSGYYWWWWHLHCSNGYSAISGKKYMVCRSVSGNSGALYCLADHIQTASRWTNEKSSRQCVFVDAPRCTYFVSAHS